jgi:hypothetical protein
MLEHKYIAYSVATDAVEAIGTEEEVIEKISETYGASQLDDLIVYQIVGEPMTVKMKLQFKENE